MPDSLSHIVDELKAINSTLSNDNGEVVTIVSTLAGVLLGAFIGGYVTHYFQNKGKIKVFLNSHKATFTKTDDYNRIYYVKSTGNPDSGKLSLDIDIINTKLVSWIIRDIRLEIVSKSDNIELTILDELSQKNYPGLVENDEFRMINVPAKSASNYKLFSWIARGQLFLINPEMKMYLKFKDHKNKEKRIALKIID